MNRRTAVALAAIAALGVSAPAAHAATKKNTITATGKTTFKVNQYIQDGSRFAPGTITVKSGTTIKLVNKSPDGAPHSLSLLKKSALPKTAAQVMTCPMCAPLLAAHQVDEQSGSVGVPVVDVGAPGFQTPGSAKTAGDSIFLPPHGKMTFQVTAKKGSVLHFFCAVHPWMQGTIKVK
jgi:plastocyanin